MCGCGGQCEGRSPTRVCGPRGRGGQPGACVVESVNLNGTHVGRGAPRQGLPRIRHARLRGRSKKAAGQSRTRAAADSGPLA